MDIEQAVFASVRNDRAHGYQLAGRSSGLSEADARELAVWGPSHDSMLGRRGQPSISTNFHRLASGAYCVSRTELAGDEYSGRGGGSVYTQMLVVPPAVLARFGNNPFAILRAATASGVMVVHDPIPPKLEPIRLFGRAAAVDLSLVAQLTRDPGPTALARWVQAALASQKLAVHSQLPADELLAGLITLLPLECRGEFSFATGLKFATGRPCRILALPEDQASWNSIARQGYSLLDLDSSPVGTLRLEGWAAYVERILSSGKLSAFAAGLDRGRPGLGMRDLNVLGDQLQSSVSSSHAPVVGSNGHTAVVCSPSRATSASGTAVAPAPTTPHTMSASKQEPPLQAPLSTVEPSLRTTVDAQSSSRETTSNVPRHANPVKAAASLSKRAGHSALADLERVLSTQPPAVLEMLERVDDLVFEAIAGNRTALEELEVVWPLASGELAPEVIERSVEQYLRCTLSIWSDSPADSHRPDRAVAAIDVLKILFGG